MMWLSAGQLMYVRIQYRERTSLHVGSLMPLLVDDWFAVTAIFPSFIGGATQMIGELVW